MKALIRHLTGLDYYEFTQFKASSDYETFELRGDFEAQEVVVLQLRSRRFSRAFNKRDTHTGFYIGNPHQSHLLVQDGRIKRRQVKHHRKLLTTKNPFRDTYVATYASIAPDLRNMGICDPRAFLDLAQKKGLKDAAEELKLFGPSEIKYSLKKIRKLIRENSILVPISGEAWSEIHETICRRDHLIDGLTNNNMIQERSKQ
jgi:hypothetical protein